MRYDYCSHTTINKGTSMDYSLISAAATSIGVAKDLAKAALGLRDFNEFSAVISQLNEQLLNAQDSLFAHNSQIHGLQQQYFDAVEKLRELEKVMAERGNYSLFELSSGFFVYRLNAAQNGGDTSTAEPLHYLCQLCFDRDRFKSVLRIGYGYCHCAGCKQERFIG